MVGVITNDVAEATFGREEQVSLYEKLDNIDVAARTLFEIRMRRKVLSGVKPTLEEMERLIDGMPGIMVV